MTDLLFNNTDDGNNGICIFWVLTSLMLMVDGGEVFCAIVQWYSSFPTVPAQSLQKKGKLTLSLDTLTHPFTDYRMKLLTLMKLIVVYYSD